MYDRYGSPMRRCRTFLCFLTFAVPAGCLRADDEAEPVSPPQEAAARDGDDWPVFLGPHGTGVSDETELLADWPAEGPPVIWEKEVGAGYSAPSVRGDRLVLHHRIADREIVECLDARTGESQWRQSYESRFQDPYGYNNGPRCTPLLTDDRCYTLGAEGKLYCTRLESGEIVWSRDLYKDFDLTNDETGQPNWFFGMGCTPVLEDGLLFVLVGGQPNSGVVAFDATTGETVWEAVGQRTWDGVETDWPGRKTYEWTGDEQVASYSSPTLATIHGRRHLLCLMRQGLVSLDPKTGAENFKYWFSSRDFESVNAARPVVIGDKIFLSAAYKVGSALLRVGEDGKSYDVLWRDPRNLLTHWSTAIHADGHVYGFSGRHENEGELRCLDLTTGDVVWSTPGFDGDLTNLARDPRTGDIVDRTTGKSIPWPFYGRGSKTQIGDRFIVLGERGTLALVKVDPEKWQELARASYKQISYPAWTAPVLSRQRLYLRDEDSLLCLDLAPQ